MKTEINSGYIDIHSHILPGLDDGPANFEQCIAAAEKYTQIGINTIVATPHHIQGTGWASSPDQISNTIKKAQKLLADAEINLKILPGMEISLTDFLCDDFVPADYQPLGLGAGGYFLVEFPFKTNNYSPASAGLQRLLSFKECRCIIAHPERCFLFQNSSAKLKELVNIGVLVQVNISSILGESGKEIQSTALEFIRSGLVHFMATDSHARKGRMPPDKSQWIRLIEIAGEKAVERALNENPRKMLADEPVRAIPSQDLNEQVNVAPAPKRFLQRLRELFG